jgi:hypothetical protein
LRAVKSANEEGIGHALGRRARASSSREPASRTRSVKAAIRYSVDAALIVIPLAVTMYFLLRPDAFNAFLAYVFRTRH